MELALLGVTDRAASDLTSNAWETTSQDGFTGRMGDSVWTQRVLWPPHQTGRTSNCDAPFPRSSCCRRCHNHCLHSLPCPWWEKRHCPGTYQPSWPHERRLLCWNSALSCTKKQHTVGRLRTQQIHAQRWANTYLPWFSVLCRRGFILRAGTSFWGDSCQVDSKWRKLH